jgi:hypothetical protein
VRSLRLLLRGSKLGPLTHKKAWKPILQGLRTSLFTIFCIPTLLSLSSSPPQPQNNNSISSSELVKQMDDLGFQKDIVLPSYNSQSQNPSTIHSSSEYREVAQSKWEHDKDGQNSGLERKRYHTGLEGALSRIQSTQHSGLVHDNDFL